MPEWIRRRERVEHKQRQREFAYEGHVRNGRSQWGFSFPVDEDGNPKDRFDQPIEGEPIWLDNWTKCLSGEVDGRKVIDLGITEDSWWVTEPGVIRCDVCLGQVVLGMVMTNTCDNCRICGQPPEYMAHRMTADECETWMRRNSEGKHGCASASEHHEFVECAADYNSSGQHLAPREQWGWDTGESVSDILNSDWPVDVSREEWVGASEDQW